MVQFFLVPGYSYKLNTSFKVHGGMMLSKFDVFSPLAATSVPGEPHLCFFDIQYGTWGLVMVKLTWYDNYFSKAWYTIKPVIKRRQSVPTF